MHTILFIFAVNITSVYLVEQLLDDFVITGGTLGYVVVGLVVGFLNIFLKPVLKVLSLPFIFLTAGLFVVVINAAILWLTSEILDVLALAEITLSISGVVTYVVAVLLLGTINYLFQKIFR